MGPREDTRNAETAPIFTWTLIGLFILIFLWDRAGNPFGVPTMFADLSLVPRSVLTSLQSVFGAGVWRGITAGSEGFPLVTLFTSMFLHGNLLHLAGNVLYLVIFGPEVEDAIGPWRFALYYLFWGIAASLAQIYMDPGSTTPIVGASGAIGGVLGAYLLLFPASKIEIMNPFADDGFEVTAWVLLGIWFLFQVFLPGDGVANWAHVGGFLAGMTTVLVMGGRHTVLAERKREGQALEP